MKNGIMDLANSTEIATIIKNIKIVIPDFAVESSDYQTPLPELGISSMDLGDVIAMTMEDLAVDGNLLQFYKSKTIAELANSMATATKR